MSEKFIEGRIVGRVDYTDSLFSLRFEAPMDPFIAGQYCRAGLILPGARGAEVTMRPLFDGQRARPASPMRFF